MSAIKSAVQMRKTTADGLDVEETVHATEGDAIRALARTCKQCGWQHTGFVAGDAIIYEIDPDGIAIVATVQLRMLGY